MPEPELKFEEASPLGDLEVLLEGIDEIPSGEPQIEGPEDLKGMTREQILQKVQQEREEANKKLAAMEEQAKLTSALKGLTQQTQQQVVRDPSQMPQQLPGETEEAFKARFNEQFYNNPYDTMMEFQRKKVAPEVQRIMGANVQMSRKLTALDPDRKDTFAQYQAEIDDMVARLSPEQKLYDIDVYTKAHDAVIARHVNEIIDRKVKEAMGKGSPQPKPTAPVPFSEQGTAPRPMGPTKTFVLSRKEQFWAAQHGLSPERAAEYFMRNPDRRIK